MNNFFKLLFLNSMIFGSLLAISSYSWFSMWLGLEINLLSIIPLFNSYKNYFPSESALKYFITQSMASTIILFSILNFTNKMEFLYFNDLFNQLSFNSAILMKLGAAPFHFWFPEIMEGLNWLNNLILLTWQKLAPLVIVSYNIEKSMFFMFVIICSSLIGGMLGLNQISLRKIMAFSSINHISWMLSSMLISNNIWLIYFIIYTLITISIILIFNKLNIFYIFQLFNSNNQKKLINLMFMLIFLSLGGLPPFLGFFSKWIVIYGLILIKMYMISFLMIVLTLISLFFYLRLMFKSLMFSSNDSIFKTTKIKKYNFVILITWNSIGLLASPLIFNFL
uniref:NADH-ubiquinone oxidoreductase chain 2 n=1 Tax=Phalacridae gen. sp. MJ-2020 TaxID=2762523 RepID=A0A7G7MU44_9CUCU|nr:NADH dehydrogenase subunit 2 [Phalacridae gen. sp. MJ-2020]